MPSISREILKRLRLDRKKITHQDQDEPRRIVCERVWILDAEVTENVADSLPDSGHDNHPTVSFLVLSSLDDMGYGRCPEKDGEENGSSERGTEVPHGIGICWVWA